MKSVSPGRTAGSLARVSSPLPAAGSGTAAPPEAAAAAPATGPSRRLKNLPLLLAFGLFGFLLLPRVQQHPHLFWSFTGVGAALVAWFVVLRLLRRSAGLSIEVIPPVKQHYIQAGVQTALYAYWGALWVTGDGTRPILAQAPLIAAQFLYLYAFEALFAWSRGRPWRLTSGPTPIILSTNLFIWFRDDWFVFQFVMITVGLLGKEFVRWTKEGRRTHVFNPSGFGLAVAATVLILTGTTDLTWARPLASQIEVEHIFVVIFVLGLVVQHFFAVTLMTLAAAAVMVALNLGYTQATGVYLFGSSNLPAAAFLGLHLLMTDPSTSPRTHVGRTLFGAGYGLGYVVAFVLLNRIGAPELYAKLYPVPILNTLVQVLDGIARRGALGRLNERWQNGLPARVTNHVHMGLWAALFVVLFTTGYVGTKGHPGNSIGFWKQALAEGRHDAERKLVMVAGGLAAQDAPDAINELGILGLESSLDRADERTRHKNAAVRFAEAARRGSAAGEANLVMLFLFEGVHRSDQELGVALQRLSLRAQQGDALARYLLGFAHELGRGVQQDARRALQLYRACGDDVFALKGIVRIGLASGSVVELDRAHAALVAAGDGGDGEAAYYVGYMHWLGRGAVRDEALARQWFEKAAAAGFAPALELLRGEGVPPFVPPRRTEIGHPPWASAYPAVTSNA